MTMETKIIRMVSGEELIARVVSETIGSENISVKNPMVLVHTGQNQIAIVPWAPFVKGNQEIAINTHLVVYISDPEDEIRNEYSKHTGGILLAKPAGQLLTE